LQIFLNIHPIISILSSTALCTRGSCLASLLQVQEKHAAGEGGRIKGEFTVVFGKHYVAVIVIKQDLLKLKYVELAKFSNGNSNF